MALGSARFEALRAANPIEKALDWQNRRLLFNPQARSATVAQQREVLRRDGYCCSTPGHRMWLELHHTVYFSRASSRYGKSISRTGLDDNLVPPSFYGFSAARLRGADGLRR